MTGAPRLVYATEPLDEVARRRVRGAKVLVPVAAGMAAQEIFKPAEVLARYGCDVTFATLRGGSARLDLLCNAIALCEAAWDPTFRLTRRAAREGTLRNLPSIDELCARGASLDDFDALLVAGGHGGAYAAFLRDPLLHEVVRGFLRPERAIGMLCHAPILLSLMERDGAALVAGRLVTCWPRSYERALGALPWLGPFFKPFGTTVGEALERAGGHVHDPGLPAHPVHAAIDGSLVTGRGPWSTTAFATALLSVLARTRERALVEQH